MSSLRGPSRTIQVGQSPSRSDFARFVETEISSVSHHATVLPTGVTPVWEVTRISVPPSISQHLLEHLAPEISSAELMSPTRHQNLLMELRQLLETRSREASSINIRNKLTGAIRCLQEEESCREILEQMRSEQFFN